MRVPSFDVHCRAEPEPADNGQAKNRRMAHQTATELNLPVIEAPAKFATVQSQSTTIVEIHTATGLSSISKNSAP